jgi:transcriptional regulator with XRE-family HTH domain
MAMPLSAQTLPPKVLAIWIRTLRTASDMSQDALAEASGVSQRTIQRVEADGRANRMTRRSLARGLGYDDYDIFDDSKFIATAIDAIAEIQSEQANMVEANHPDHIKLEVEIVGRGVQITGLIDLCDAWVFECHDDVNGAGENAAAVLFDNIRDYCDVWSDIPPSGRLEAKDAFTEMLADIARHGLCAYLARRSAHVAPSQAGQAAVPFNIGYFGIVPAGQTPSHILVPKRF